MKETHAEISYINNEGESIIEEALNQASQYIAKKDCPRVIMDNEPWTEGCNKVCNKYSGTDEWKCWKRYFLNLHK